MKLQFKPKEIYIENPQLLDAEKCYITIEPTNRARELSHQLNIRIEDPNVDKDSYASFWINKNEAIYMANILLAFAKEEDIDPEDED